MRRYIEAEEVEKRIDIVLGSEPKAWDKKALKELKMYVVHAAPTADVRENVRGYWKKRKDKPLQNWYQCSNCGAICGETPKYCSECGADMRGEL